MRSQVCDLWLINHHPHAFTWHWYFRSKHSNIEQSVLLQKQLNVLISISNALQLFNACMCLDSDYLPHHVASMCVIEPNKIMVHISANKLLLKILLVPVNFLRIQGALIISSSTVVYPVSQHTMVLLCHSGTIHHARVSNGCANH